MTIGLRNQKLICIVTSSQSAFQSLVTTVSARKKRLHLTYNPKTQKGIPVFDRELTADEKRLIGIGVEKMPCYAYVQFSPEGHPVKVLGSPAAMQSNVECVYDVDLMMSRLLNTMSESECTQLTGLDLSSVQELRGLTQPNQNVIYCVGSDDSETQRLGQSVRHARARSGLTTPVSAVSAQDFGQSTLARLGLSGQDPPFLAVITNSPEGNPSVIAGGGVIRNCSNFTSDAESICNFVTTGSLLSTNSKVSTSGTGTSSGSPLNLDSNNVERQSDGSLGYSLALSNLRRGPDGNASVQLKAYVSESPGSNGSLLSNQTVRPTVQGSQATLEGSIPLNQLEPGTYWVRLEAMDLYSYQKVNAESQVEVRPKAPVAVMPPPSQDRLTPGQQITSGAELRSVDGRFGLACQNDGNLVLYDGNRPVWSTGTHGFNPVLSLDSDGYLRLRDGSGSVLWNSPNGAGGTNCFFLLQTDGNAVLYRSDGSGGGTPVWASH